jgi:DNA-binding response OmpR family regulator
MNDVSKKKILIADDDPGMRLALLVRLRANNYEVSCVGDGLSVIFETRKSAPDLIILDLGLPSGDGFTVLEMLQEDDAHVGIPVIVLSGRDRETSRDRAIEAGALMFLQKPVGTSELLMAVDHALQVKETVPPRPAAGRA